MRRLRRMVQGLFLLACAAVPAESVCTYFRVKAKLDKCRTSDVKTLKGVESYSADSDVPELESPSTDGRPVVMVTCSCEYSLSGSNPRCDTDQSFERSAVLGAESDSITCRRRDSLCRDVCPSRLP